MMERPLPGLGGEEVRQENHQDSDKGNVFSLGENLDGSRARCLRRAYRLGMVVCTYNQSTQEAEASGFMGI